MARKNRSNGNAGNGIPQAPEGFGINVGRDRGDGWAHKEEGNKIQGRLLGRHTYKGANGKQRAYYQVKLSEPCKALIEDPNAAEGDEEAERVVVTLDAGKIVNVDESVKLADLADFTKNGGTYDIWFVYGTKEAIGNGQSMWNVFGPRLAVVSKPDELPG